jgi:hypothetical protein
MKIEIGESLFYSWLRHFKGCQVVQTNWKPSPEWKWQHVESLERFRDAVEECFKSDYSVFKQTKSLSQLIGQAEIDVLGLAFGSKAPLVYAVDVAFHESGLNYGDTIETTAKVIRKCARAAICLRACFGVSDGDIVFASPKINPNILNELEPALKRLNTVLREHDLGFVARLIANVEFKERVLEPILIVSKGVADTSELFMRGYQLTTLLGPMGPSTSPLPPTQRSPPPRPDGAWSGMKIGLLANTVLRQVLQRGIADDELKNLQDRDHSREVFGINYPLLLPENFARNRRRYYAEPVTINRSQFQLCSQWYEQQANNDRPLLIAWLKRHHAADENGI